MYGGSQNQGERNNNQEIDMNTLRPVLGCAACVVICIMVPLIVLNFVMANGDSPCLTQEITKYSIDINLRTWLLVQAYVLLAVAVLILLAIILACVSPVVGGVFGTLVACLAIPISLFNIAWTIVGAIMFWGELQPAGTCHQGLEIYMWIILILGCLSICSTCTSCLRGGNSSA